MPIAFALYVQWNLRRAFTPDKRFMLHSARLMFKHQSA